MRVAFAGGGHLGLNLVNALLESRHTLVALVQNGRHLRGMRRVVEPWRQRLLFMGQSPLMAAGRHGIPVIYIDKMTDDELAPLRALQIDLLVVGGFSIILKEPILRLPAIGCLNVHSSLLPKHRGPNPFTAVVLAGDTESGVTFHVMDSRIDTGDIVAQYRFPVEPQWNAGDVYAKSCTLAGERILDVLDRVAHDGLQGVPQDNSIATYDKKLKPEEACIPWNRSAADIDRLIRALTPFERARFQWRGKTVYVLRATHDPLPVQAAPGTFVALRPDCVIATGEGSVRIELAYSTRPVPWVWPPMWAWPRIGERVE